MVKHMLDIHSNTLGIIYWEAKKKILCYKEAASLCAVNSYLKHFKKRGSAASLKLMSRRKIPKFLPESLDAIWQLFYESWLVYIFLFAQTAKTVLLSLADILFLNRRSRIYFQSRENSGNFEGSKRNSPNRNSFWSHLSA